MENRNQLMIQHIENDLPFAIIDKAKYGQRINALLVYPKNPSGTYWGFEHALPFIRKPMEKPKSTMPGLALLTIPNFFPENFHFKYIDLNIESLKEEDIEWSDIILTSSMIVNKESIEGIAQRVDQYNKMIVYGGPFPTENFDEIHYGNGIFVLNEAELTLSLFLEDLKKGMPKRVYARPSSETQRQDLIRKFGSGTDTDIELTKTWADLKQTPRVRYDLLKLNRYHSMIIQLSRGCPMGCNFCGVRKLNGGMTRYYPVDIVLENLDALFESGWRGSLFVADDNTIGNYGQANKIFKAIAQWQKKHKYPFQLGTEISVNFASNPKMLDGYREAGGTFGFIGIETPNVKSLYECGKQINLKELLKREGMSFKDVPTLTEEQERDLSNKQTAQIISCTHKIQNAGIEVFYGLIVGFDNDPLETFDRQIKIIQEGGVPVAMIGLLCVLKGTSFYDQLSEQGRLKGEIGGVNTHSFTTNYVREGFAKLSDCDLKEGYRRVLNTLYDNNLSHYLARSQILLNNLGENKNFSRAVGLAELSALVRAFVKLGTRKPYSKKLRRFLWYNLCHHPKKFAEAVRLVIYGYHFRKITQRSVMKDDLLDYVITEHHSFINELQERVTNVLGQIAGYSDGIREYLSEDNNRFIAFMEEKTDEILASGSDLQKYLKLEKEKLVMNIKEFFTKKTRFYRKEMRQSYRILLDRIEAIELKSLGLNVNLDLSC